MRPLLGRLRRRDDDRGSIMMVFLVMIIAAGLGGMMLPSLLTQSDSTRFDVSRVRTLHAAQTGIDVVLGEFRATTMTDSRGVVWGDDSGLPCYPSSSPLVGSGDGDSRYSVTVGYYLTDPSLADATPMSVCAQGSGPYDPSTGSRTPRYALVTSTGTDTEGGEAVSHGRTIVTTYVFQTDDTNITGGVIRLFPDSSSNNQWCMDAGSATPSDGTQVLLRACSTSNPPAPQQVFAYRSDLSIQLVSSATSANPNGECLDTQSTPHAAGDTMVLKTCSIADPTRCGSVRTCSPWNQQWSVDDNAHLEGAKNDRSDIDGYCINAASQTDGVALNLQSCAGSVTDTKQTWVPSPSAGAGMAGADNNQLVNYKLFATCLDVTGQDVTSTFLILYTCKQNPDPTKVSWNQKFTPSPALGTGPTQVLLKTTFSGRAYCLTSPLSRNGYVTVTTPCPSSVTAAGSSSKFVWTVSQTQDSSGGDLPYAQKYTIVDAARRCLGPGPNSDLLNGQYYKTVTAPCDGTTGQKWNASASLDNSTLENTHETER